MPALASPFPQITTPPQALAEVVVNENLAAISHQAVYAYAFLTSSGLTWGYYGGRWGGFSVAAGTLTLTGSATNYVVVNKASGVISASTSAANWNDGTNYARVYKLTAGASAVTAAEDHRAGASGVHGGGATGATTQVIAIACSDEVTALTAGTAKTTFRMPYAFTLSEARASLTVAQASGSIFTVDINESGSTVLSTKLTIDNTEKTSKTAATPAVISDSALADDAEITIDIDQVGASGAAGLKVYLVGTRT